MKCKMLTATLLLCASLIAAEDFSRGDGKTTIKGGRMEFKLPDLDGKEVAHDDPRFEGKVVLLTLWGSWCGPCLQEIPFLKRIHAQYEADGLEVVALAFEQKGTTAQKLENLQKFVNRKEIDYLVLFAGSTLATRTKLPTLKGFEGFPTTMLIDRQGVVRHIEINYNEEIAKNSEVNLRALLSEESKSTAVESE